MLLVLLCVTSSAGFPCFVQVYLVQPVCLYKRVVCFCNIWMLVLFFWRLKLKVELLQFVNVIIATYNKTRC